jgi:hypothetical protein
MLGVLLFQTLTAGGNPMADEGFERKLITIRSADVIGYPVKRTKVLLISSAHRVYPIISFNTLPEELHEK